MVSLDTMMYFDPLYFLLLAPAFLLSIVASLLLQFWSNRYLRISTRSGLNGHTAAELIAKGEGLDISLQGVGGQLTDNYDPRVKTVSLSESVGKNSSIGAVAIAAHEMGHVSQHQRGSLLFQLRSVMVPAVSIGSNLGYFLIIIGLLLSVTNLAWVGLLLFSLTAVFSLLTLPIEVDASIRGMGFIREYNLLGESELGGARKVLFAAALTYVAALLSSLLNVLYFALRISGSSRRND